MMLRLRGTQLATLACAFGGLLLPCAEAQARTEKLVTVPAGQQRNQLGVVDTPNAGCRGPEAIAFKSDSEFLVLDSVNGRLSQGRLGAGVRTMMPIPEARYLKDMLLVGDGVVVLDAGAGSVVRMTGAGDVAARLSIAKGIVDGGSARLAATGAQEVVVQPTGRQAQVLRFKDQGADLRTTPAGVTQPDYEFTKTADNAGKLLLRGTPAPSLPKELGIETKNILAHASVAGSDAQGRTYVWVEEIVDRGTLSGPTTLLRYSKEGRIDGTSEVPVADYDCLPNRPIAVSPKGRVLFLGVGRGRPIDILEIKLDNPSPAPERRGDAAKAEPELGKADLEMLRYIERLNGDAAAVPLDARIAPIERSEVLVRARAARDLKWTVSAGNYERAGMPSQCNPQSRIWLRPAYLTGMRAKSVTGIPYRWGGYHKELADWSKQQEAGALAGNVCTCRTGNYCIVSGAIGLDCSGFVSYSWRTAYHTTASLSAIADKVRFDELKPGDALNHAGSHVRLVEEVKDGPGGIVVNVIESALSCVCASETGESGTGCVCSATYTPAQLRRYAPIRFKGIRD
jgi:hypothetical protein